MSRQPSLADLAVDFLDRRPRHAVDDPFPARDISTIKFRYRCGSREFHSFAQRGVPHHMKSRLPPRPKRRDELDVL
jgi:hypothetical protein